MRGLLLVSVLLCCIFIKESMTIYQPSYQVMLYLRDEHSNAQKSHLCNGIIVQRRLILTTAICVHKRNNNTTLIDTNNIEIVAGSSSLLQTPLVVSQVNRIYVADGFNITSRANDLALISLKAVLPLGLRHDIKWIILDDTGVGVGSGLTYFTYSNCYKRLKGNMQMTEVKIVDSQLCNLRNLYSTELCSYYKLADDMDCGNFHEFLHNFGDRGTGLIKNSCLVAILSEVAANINQNINNSILSEFCTTSLMSAGYTAIAPHVEWIYNIVAYEEQIDVTKGQNQFSIPYHTRDIQQNYTIQCRAAATKEETTTPKMKPYCNNTVTHIAGSDVENMNQINLANQNRINLLLLFSYFLILGAFKTLDFL